LVLTVFAENASPAPKLEVEYPEIQGKTLTPSTPLPDVAIYLFNAGMIVGFFAVVASLVWGGVLYAFSGVASLVQKKIDAKDRIFGAISGLLIILLTYLIITTINPELSIFKSEKLEEEKISEVEAIKIPGVYFYKSETCDEKENPSPRTASLSDLGDMKNNLKSAKIIKDYKNFKNTSFISLLYKNPNFWGDCRYLEPNEVCNQNLSPEYSSASIYRYNFEPEEKAGNGVYFFRKPCINDKKVDYSKTDPATKSYSIQKADFDFKNIDDIINYCKHPNVGGGYFYISYQDIKEKINSSIIFEAKLNELKMKNSSEPGFIDVPTLEQDCKKYDRNNECSEKIAPTLSG
jgi:hypothetical protein